MASLRGKMNGSNLKYVMVISMSTAVYSAKSEARCMPAIFVLKKFQWHISFQRSCPAL